MTDERLTSVLSYPSSLDNIVPVLVLIAEILDGNRTLCRFWFETVSVHDNPNCLE